MNGMQSRRIWKYHRKISGLSCSFCVETIRKAIQRLDGVKEVNISLSHEEILVIYDPEKISEDILTETLKNLGYRVGSPRKLRELNEEEFLKAQKYLIYAGILTITSLIPMSLMWIGIKSGVFKWIMLILALATMFGPGLHIKKMAWHSLRSRILNQHVLLEMGAFSGLIGGFLGIILYPSFPSTDFLAVSIFLTGYHILGEWSSLYVKTKASKAVDRLLMLQPEEAVVVEDGVEMVKKVDDLRIGEIVRVRPGQRIPIDGVVIRGYASIDESIVTGESIPIEKGPGDMVVGGSINTSGSIDIRVTRVGEETFIRQVAKIVEEAKALKPSILLIVDKVLKYYVPIVMSISIGAFLIWTAGIYILYNNINIDRAIYAALSVLVMGYPCAIGMAMPLALIWGGGEAAKKGILMRSGEAFQILPSIDKVVLDKTGTLTKGEIEIIDVICIKDRDAVYKYLGSAEILSEHPIAKAVINYLDKFGVEYGVPDEFYTYHGSGVEAGVSGKYVLVGEPHLLINKGIEMGKEILRRIDELEEKGRGVVCIALDGEVAGLIVYADPIKEGAKETIDELRRRGIETIMLTGDNWRVAESIARELGIEEYYAQVKPDEKMRIIRRIQMNGYRVAMVGDGVNDAPSLMQADVGIAIGAGTDIAVDSADIVIIGNDVKKVVETIDIAGRSYRKTKENLLLAFLFNGLGVPIAATGILHPSMAMIAMALSVTTILLNSFGTKILKNYSNKSLVFL